MASTTPNKKAVADFLWEWATNQGNWGKLLVDKIVTSESALSTSDRKEVFDYFLQSLDLYQGQELPLLSILKPNYIPTGKQVELDSISDIAGVNRLAKNQTINFAKNITVIYGENGTGKTGYSRILKTLGFSYDVNKDILPNIYANAESQSATINFRSDGISKSFVWNGKNHDSELANISVFDGNCVQISICDRDLIVSPAGLHLFQLVSDELMEMTRLLQSKKLAYPTSLDWHKNLTSTTPQYDFITTLSANSTESELKKLSDFTQDHRTTLTAKETELENLNVLLLQNKTQTMGSQIQELDQLIEKIQKTRHIFSMEKWQTLIDCNQRIAELEKKSQTKIEDIAEQRGIVFYQSTEFSAFITAAEQYIGLLNKPEYPAEGDTCVYCLQPLDNSAKELLGRYRALFNDKSRENLTTLRKQKSDLCQSVSEIETNLTIHQSTFGIDDNQRFVQPEEIVIYNQKLETLKTAFINDTITQDAVFDIDYQAILSFLDSKRTTINKELADQTGILAGIEQRKNVLKNKINELQDRGFLSKKIAEIKNVITNHKIIEKINKHEKSFSTTAISRKTSAAREELVKQEFEDIFKNELSGLRNSNLKIDLSFETVKGNSKVIQNINKHALTKILSEGEQKTIALAEFLTELQLDHTKAPVVFDDPVNSLDHKMIDEVARRIFKFSRERQVIIFTHSVLLFNSLLYFSKLPSFGDIVCRFYNSRNEYDVTGFIAEAEEEINKVKFYISKINLLINNSHRDRAEKGIAEDGYSFLRSAIEVFIEHEVFLGTVKRYQKNVALTNFLKVRGALLDAHKNGLNEIFERCCGFIKGHSNPIEIHNDPTVDELKQDFEEFEQIRSQFLKKE